MGILNGLHRGGKQCSAPRAKEVDLWIDLAEEIGKVRDKDISF